MTDYTHLPPPPSVPPPQQNDTNTKLLWGLGGAIAAFIILIALALHFADDVATHTNSSTRTSQNRTATATVEQKWDALHQFEKSNVCRAFWMEPDSQIHTELVRGGLSNNEATAWIALLWDRC